MANLNTTHHSSIILKLPTYVPSSLLKASSQDWWSSWSTRGLVEGHFLGGHCFSKVTAQHHNCIASPRVRTFPLALLHQGKRSKMFIYTWQPQTLTQQAVPKCACVRIMYEFWFMVSHTQLITQEFSPSLLPEYLLSGSMPTVGMLLDNNI